MTETADREIVLGDGRPWRGHRPVLWLSWVDSDPLAVVVVVGARPPHPALLRGRWVVLRDALRALLAPEPEPAPEPAPDGGLHAPPRPSGYVSMSREAEHVTLTLQSVPLPCVVTVPAGPMREFVAETDAIVPPGGESWTSALDAEIARMLGAE